MATLTTLKIMAKGHIYSEEEIAKALFDLNNNLDNKVYERKNINAEIARIKKSIQFYEQLDKRQYKISWD